MATSLRLIPIVVLILVTLGADKVQAEAVCSNTPTARQWIECTEDAPSTDDIAIDLKSGVNITTIGKRDHGILGHHEAQGTSPSMSREPRIKKRSAQVAATPTAFLLLVRVTAVSMSPLTMSTSLRQGQMDKTPMESRPDRILALLARLPTTAPTMSKSRLSLARSTRWVARAMVYPDITAEIRSI